MVMQFFYTSYKVPDFVAKKLYTCDSHRVLATPQFSKTLHHHRKQKIAHVTVALLPCDIGETGYQLKRTYPYALAITFSTYHKDADILDLQRC